MAARLVVILEADGVSIAAGGKVQRKLDVRRYTALRVLIDFDGAGAGEVRVNWKTSDDAGEVTILDSPEVVTLTGGYAEIPTRSAIAVVQVVETGGADPITATGSILGLAL